MKQTNKWICILLIATIIFSIKAKAQPFIGVGIGNTVTATGGLLVNQFQISVNYSRPFSNNVRPAVASIELGRQIFIGETGSLTISAGGASYSYKDFSKYNEEGNWAIGKVSEFKPIYGIELGIDKGMGRLSIYGKYFGVYQFGMGLKMFFKND